VRILAEISKLSVTVDFKNEEPKEIRKRAKIILLKSPM
jgi:hypothetical protein